MLLDVMLPRLDGFTVLKMLRDSDVNENTVYVFIRSLRAKVAQEHETQLLQTARGIGYTLRCDAV